MKSKIIEFKKTKLIEVINKMEEHELDELSRNLRVTDHSCIMSNAGLT